jgi:hypothetical protein
MKRSPKKKKKENYEQEKGGERGRENEEVSSERVGEEKKN